VLRLNATSAAALATAAVKKRKRLTMVDPRRSPNQILAYRLYGQTMNSRPVSVVKNFLEAVPFPSDPSRWVNRPETGELKLEPPPGSAGLVQPETSPPSCTLEKHVTQEVGSARRRLAESLADSRTDRALSVRVTEDTTIRRQITASTPRHHKKQCDRSRHCANYQ
jgi:hypothetical protein